jgi:hypothetical protein
VSRLLAGTAQERQDFARFVAGRDGGRFASTLLTLLGDSNVGPANRPT